MARSAFVHLGRDMRSSAPAAVMLGGLCAAWSQSLVAQEPGALEICRPAESASGASESELAVRSQNPIEDMVNIPVEGNLDYGLGPNYRAQSTLKIEPRIPAHVLPSWNMVIRTIIPITYKPITMATTGGSSGLGDVNPTFFLTQAHPGPVIWGVGPDFELPTATQTSLGTGNWSVGPSLAVVAKLKPWTIGFIASNIWSFAGQSGRSRVDKGSLEYFIHYNLASGWSLRTSPTVTAEWNKMPGDIWTVPVGGGAAKVFKLGKIAINASLAAYVYVAKPSDGPDWELRCEASFLFPR